MNREVELCEQGGWVELVEQGGGAGLCVNREVVVLCEEGGGTV